jgi:hypothetical protein
VCWGKIDLGCFSNIFCTALCDDVGRDPSFEELQPQRYNQNVIQLTHDGNEIRQKLDGTKNVKYRTTRHQLCVPRNFRMPHCTPNDLKFLQERSGLALERLAKPAVRNRFLAIPDVDFRFYLDSAPELAFGRTMHLKPMWQVPVSTGWAMRAAGR